MLVNGGTGVSSCGPNFPFLSHIRAATHAISISKCRGMKTENSHPAFRSQGRGNAQAFYTGMKHNA